jgi:hypothetical protein
MNKNQKNFVFTLLVIVVLAGLLYFPKFFSKKEKLSPAKVALAQCLSERGVVMYGADWCPHCGNEKKAFGDAFKYVNYVECPEKPKLCIEKGIEGYPTWIFPDGKKLVGEQGLEKLAAESGCQIENQSQ